MEIESRDIILILVGFISGATLVLVTARTFYKQGLAVSAMIYRAVRGEDPLPEPDDGADSIDENPQETTT